MTKSVEPGDLRLLDEVYRAFNARDIDRAVAGFAPDVDWPNAFEGGRVIGVPGVREYWTRQWTQIDPHVEIRDAHVDDAGHVVARVHQLVRDRSGQLLSDRMVEHVYTIAGGLIQRMDVRA